MLQPSSVRHLFADDNDARFAARRFCMSIQAARLMEFGWESHVDQYEPRELALLATQMPPVQRDILMSEAQRRMQEVVHGQ